jgi:hypothetical protein
LGTVNPSAYAYQVRILDPPRSRNGPRPAPIRSGPIFVISGAVRSYPDIYGCSRPIRALVLNPGGSWSGRGVCCDLGTRTQLRRLGGGPPLYPAYRPARPPRASPPALKGDAVELTSRHALATSPGFSILLDVRRPDDGPRTDLARWARVASRRPGAARPRGASGTTFPPHGRPTLPDLPPRHRMVVLEEGRRDATPNTPRRLATCVSHPGGLPGCGAASARVGCAEPGGWLCAEHRPAI